MQDVVNQTVCIVQPIHAVIQVTYSHRVALEHLHKVYM